MPAIPPYIINTANGTGLRLADVGLAGDELFMLVSSVTDSAEFQEEILIKNTAGKRIYHALLDPVLTYSFNTTVLAFHGLANAAPGTDVKAGLGAITPALLNNVLTNNFQFSSDGDTKFTLRRPRRTRRAGDLADYSFDIVVTNANVDFGLGATQHIPTAPATVYTAPTTALPRYDLLTGYSLISLRLLTITGPISGYNHFTNLRYWRTWPASTTPPADLGAYLYGFDFPSATNKVLYEIFATDVPGGRYISLGSSPGSTGSSGPGYGSGYGYGGSGTVIQTALAAGALDAFPPPTWTHVMEAIKTGSSPIYRTVNARGSSTAAEFIAAGYVPTGYTLQSLYSLAELTWLTIP